MPAALIRGRREIVADHDAPLVDFWGAIRGTVAPPYPQVLEALAALRAAERPGALLSTAPRRAAAVARRLGHPGVPPAAYDGLVTASPTARCCDAPLGCSASPRTVAPW